MQAGAAAGRADQWRGSTGSISWTHVGSALLSAQLQCTVTVQLWHAWSIERPFLPALDQGLLPLLCLFNRELQCRHGLATVLASRAEPRPAPWQRPNGRRCIRSATEHSREGACEELGAIRCPLQAEPRQPGRVLGRAGREVHLEETVEQSGLHVSSRMLPNPRHGRAFIRCVGSSSRRASGRRSAGGRCCCCCCAPGDAPLPAGTTAERGRAPIATACRHNFDLRSGSVFIKWFEQGETNICYNALDRHVEAGHGDRIAFYWEASGCIQALLLSSCSCSAAAQAPARTPSPAQGAG